MTAKTKEIGIAVVGSGRIGSLRARLAAKHPAVSFLAVSDKEPAHAKALAELAAADLCAADNDAVIAHPRVNAVIVSTPEGEHAAPVRRALELGKPVLVEKPLALSLADAAAIMATLERFGGTLRVGYSRRFKECFLRAKEQIVAGRLGRISGALGSDRAHGLAPWRAASVARGQGALAGAARRAREIRQEAA